MKRRPILDGKTSSNLNEDPIIGKLVAYPYNSSSGLQKKSAFGKLWDTAAICYQLDSSEGHIVGTVLWKLKVSSKKQKGNNQYEVVWEFSALGLNILESPFSYCFVISSTYMKNIEHQIPFFSHPI